MSLNCLINTKIGAKKVSIHIEQWWEDLIEEQELADELEKQGYSYKQAMDLIRKHGVNHVKWLLEGAKK